MTEAFNQQELNDWREGLDIPALRERLAEAAAPENGDNPNARAALAALGAVYGNIETGNYGEARSLFRGLEGFLRETAGWEEGEGHPLPSPLDEEGISKMFWQACRALSSEAVPTA